MSSGSATISSPFYVDGQTLSEGELQSRLIFSVIVAGKNADFASNVIRKLFIDNKELPFDTLQKWIEWGILEERLRECKSGNYGKLAKCLPELIKVNPSTVSLDELETIHGVGPKTSRFYHLWIGKKTRCAALDTHVLKFLRELGYMAPKSTPSGKKYKELEQAFLKECDRRGKTPNQLDAEIWEAYSSKDQIKIKKLYERKRKTNQA